MSWTFLRSIRLELTWPRESKASWYALAGMLSLLLLGLLGATITQHQPERLLLSRSQWQVLQAQRQTRQDVARMTRDLSQLAHIGTSQRSDPVEAVWMAQRLYSRHKEGTPSSATARQALIEAGQIAVQVANGTQHPESLESALQTVKRLLVLLQTP